MENEIWRQLNTSPNPNVELLLKHENLFGCLGKFIRLYCTAKQHFQELTNNCGTGSQRLTCSPAKQLEANLHSLTTSSCLSFLLPFTSTSARQCV